MNSYNSTANSSAYTCETPPKRLRVLFVGSFLSPHETHVRGGVQFECISILKESDPQKVEWVLIDTTMESLPAPALLRRAWLASHRMFRFLYITTTNRFDCILIYTSSGWSFYEKGLMALVGKALGNRVVMRPVSGFIIDDFRRSRVLHRYIPFVLRRCDLVVCQGQRWRECFQAITGMSAGRFCLVNNCIACNDYVHLTLPPPRSTIKLLLIGWVERNKGVFDLVDVVDKFRQELGDIKIVICGHGTAWGELHELIATKGLGELFDFRGWVDHKEILSLLQDSEISLMLSHGEGMPNALLEAMAAGRAVIATAVGAVADVVFDGQTGFLCEPGDLDDIGFRILDLRRDAALRIRMGQLAREQILQRYNSGSVWSNWLQVLSPDEAPSKG